MQWTPRGSVGSDYDRRAFIALPVGSKVGPYEVLSLLGTGGMGEVYRARDTKLDRDVALKILPESFARDPDRLMRFSREAKTLAALNHPNIATIYGLTEKTSEVVFRALVMALVEGDDLSALIARGPIPWSNAQPIARQIIDALETAHESGLQRLHLDRDLAIELRIAGAIHLAHPADAERTEDLEDAERRAGRQGHEGRASICTSSRDMLPPRVRDLLADLGVAIQVR